MFDPIRILGLFLLIVVIAYIFASRKAVEGDKTYERRRLWVRMLHRLAVKSQVCIITAMQGGHGSTSSKSAGRNHLYFDGTVRPHGRVFTAREWQDRVARANAITSRYINPNAICPGFNDRIAKAVEQNGG